MARWRVGLCRFAITAAVLTQLGCAGLNDRSAPGTSPGALLQTPATDVPWTPLTWPGKNNVGFEPVEHQGRPALRVKADRSMSILRQRLADGPLQPDRIEFSWAVNALFQRGDIGVSGQDDAPVRVVLAFDGDRSKLSMRARMQSELSRAVLGEDIPYATLTYVWCNTRPTGTVLVSPRSDRVRKIVVESGVDHVGRWRDYQRDVRADFRRAFGEDPGPLIGVALMTDADNTGERLTAWYGALRLTAQPH